MIEQGIDGCIEWLDIVQIALTTNIFLCGDIYGL
jgi:hypothetical protein